MGLLPMRVIRFLRGLGSRLFGSREDSGCEPTRVIVGLGNPGPEYAATRHNVGFRIVEGLAARFDGAWREDPSLDSRTCCVEIAGESCLLVQPQSFMNRSGTSVRRVFERWPELDATADLLVIQDDLDLPTGRLRLRPGGGAGGHRGLADILEALGTRSVPRLRFGVGHPGTSGTVVDWVLEPFPAEEESTILPNAIERAVDAIEMSIREGLTLAMGRFNAAQ